jgi:hypothetical protein
MIKPDLYMKGDTLYLVIPTPNTKPIKVVFDNNDNDKPESIEENPFLQNSICY